MSKSKYQKFEVVELNRKDIKKAPYNPRRLTEPAKKKLKKFLQDHGLWNALIVNKRTGYTLVGGHQRLGIIDSLEGTDDYTLDFNVIDVEENVEKKGNIFLNNPSAQGEYEQDKLKELLFDIKDDFDLNDLGFDKLDLEYIFQGDKEFQNSIFSPQNEAQAKAVELSDEQREDNLRKVKEQKAKERSLRNADNQEAEGAEGYAAKDDDYMVTFVFDTNSAKRDFMQRIKKDPKEKYVKSNILYDIQDGRYKVYGPKDE